MASTVPELAYDSDEISEQAPPGEPACTGYAYELPDQPLISIRSSRTWVALNLRDLWAYRELLFFLTWRDVQVRYKQTALGAAWAILQPLMTMIVFSIFFGRLAGVSSGPVPYPLFAIAGLLPWTFFSNAISGAGMSVVGSERLITKIYFPQLIIPVSAVGAGLVDFLIACGMLGVSYGLLSSRPSAGRRACPAVRGRALHRRGGDGFTACGAERGLSR
jgi:ABC-2 type transporter